MIGVRHYIREFFRRHPVGSYLTQRKNCIVYVTQFISTIPVDFDDIFGEEYVNSYQQKISDGIVTYIH